MTDSTNGTGKTGNPLFAQLVMMLSSSALQNLGQAAGPGGEPPSVDLRGAEYMIDLLDMIEHKTEGNLDANEKKMLTEMLAAIRLAFVRAAQGEAPAADEAAAPEPEARPTAPAEPENGKDAVSTPPEKGEEPRFHKTYG